MEASKKRTSVEEHKPSAANLVAGEENTDGMFCAITVCTSGLLTLLTVFAGGVTAMKECWRVVLVGVMGGGMLFGGGIRRLCLDGGA